MAALDFPNAPAANQLFTAANGVTYQWTGTLWAAYGTQSTASTVATPTVDTVNTLITDPNTGPVVGDNPMTISMGQAVFTRSFTAKVAANPIEVDIDGVAGGNVTGWNCLGLFIDGASPAVAQEVVTSNANWNTQLRLRWSGVLAAGAHTFHVRFAFTNGSGILNGGNGTRLGAGAQRTTMTIREVGTPAQGPAGPPGPAGSGWSRLQADVLLGAPAPTIDITAIPSSVVAVQLVGFLMPITNAVTPQVLFQTGGSTWQTGANYNGGGMYGSPQPAAAGFGSQAANSIIIAPANSILNSAVGGLAFDLKLTNVQCPVGLPLLTGTASFWGGANINAEAVTGHLNIAATPITGLRLQFTSGNIAVGSRLSALALQ